MMINNENDKWDYEAYLTDTGQWFGKRCPAIVFEVYTGEEYQIQWSNCNTASKYVYDMRKCSGQYLLVNSYSPDGTAEPSGNIKITIPSSGLLYVGIGSNTVAENGSLLQSGFDGDYIRVRKVN